MNDPRMTRPIVNFSGTSFLAMDRAEPVRIVSPTVPKHWRTESRGWATTRARRARRAAS